MAEPTLIDMPGNVMRIIAEHSGFISIQLLRKVCHDLRNLIDDIQPSSDLHKVSVEVSTESITLVLESKEGKKYEVTYSKHLAGCMVKRVHDSKTKKKYFAGNQFSNMASQDLQLILMAAGKLKKLSIEREKDQGKGVQGSEKILDGFLDQLRLGTRSQKLKIKKLKMKVKSQSHIMSILPFLEPGTLEKIIFYHPNLNDFVVGAQKSMEFDEIVQTEQWKGAVELKMTHFAYSGPVEGLVRFGTVEMSIGSINLEQIMVLKAALKHSPALRTWSITYDRFPDHQKIRDVLGEPQLNQNNIQVGWFSRIPNRSDVLSMFMLPGQLLNFTLFDDFMVPPNVIVRD